MALVTPSVMLNSIMANIYDVLTSGDDTVPKSEDNFFSWATPGIPVEPSDFEFLSQGLTGIVKKAALDEMRRNNGNTQATSTGGNTEASSTTGKSETSSGEPEITPALLEQLRAHDTARLYMQAENFARLVDFVPDLAAATNNQFARLSVMNNEGSLSDRYEYILRMSQVMESELPQTTKDKIAKFRTLLTVPKKKKNLIDDSEEVIIEPSPMVTAYNQKMEAYLNDCLDYNARRIDALAADNSRAVQYWAINANILRKKVTAAMNDWVSNGYKNDYDAIAAFIDQVMQRDMALLKQQYRDDLEKARLTGLASGSDFYFTSLVPGNFINAAGWAEFGFTSSDYTRYQNSSYKLSSSTTSGGGGFLGIFTGGGSHSEASGQSEANVRFDTSQFAMNFKIAQVPITRPWFKTAFLMSKSWRFDQNDPEAKIQVVSDGGRPAKGMIPAYPTSLICIKDLRIFFGKSSGFNELRSQWESSSSSGGGFFSFGPIHLGGTHGRSSGSGARSSNYHYDSNTQWMTVPGVQIIGFKCHILPKSPNPLPTITNWI